MCAASALMLGLPLVATAGLDGPPTEEAVLGDWVVPDPRGWRVRHFKAVRGSEECFSSVTATRSVGGVRLRLMVTRFGIPKGVDPALIPDRPGFGETVRQLTRDGTRAERADESETAFQGRRAWLRRFVLVSNTGRTELTLLEFRDGRADYQIAANATGRSISARARSELEAARSALMRGMRRLPDAAGRSAR
ncbi:MAG TPA: hypothetical protein VLH79_07230 [Chthonomonadales bacterium]|nr:hypothetical protein [Chthonomonadales bacterium]